MSSRVRILCFIVTHPGNLQEKAAHVKVTWARRCNTVLFISSENTDFPTIAVVDHEGREYLWQKTSGAFDYIYTHYLDKADWFLKADDDTYVIVENLRKLVSVYNPDEPIFFGRKFKRPNNDKIVFMQGGAGYVLSRKAVELLVVNIFRNSKYASRMNRHPPEDAMISALLLEAGVKEGYSRDGIHETFHPAAPEDTVVPDTFPIVHKFASFNFYPVKQGLECCSNYTISFHYVTPDTMYWLEHMVYQLRPFGVGYYACPSDIRAIVGLQEDPQDGSVNATEGQGATNVETKEELPNKKPKEKPEPQKKRDPKRKSVIAPVNTEDLAEKKKEEKTKSEKKRAPRRREKRVKGDDDVKEDEK
ncbi:Glycoprotein-N-acetylgalactosamine 3-beta-galactosyltransferase 1 [Holothuria leucospilota]|uniref:N-acetylgalactosaminide beta-1,3-galactosyltransferase n=1 Tax=Holothuria leucospilota TaxID=206669 RepID=A0A9Q1BH57_HOLLE|nr:Glycoprotein-N-acetylgalactosamine 3-beta-galactosyltransferase 1 [Holothuria leucospilota]